MFAREWCVVPTQNALLSITRVHVSVCPATRGRPVITHLAVDRLLSTATPAVTVLTTLTATSRFADVSPYLKSHYLKQNISSFFTYCRFLLLNKVILISSFKFIDLCLVLQPGVSRTASVAWRSSVCKASVATLARREGCAAWTQSVASTTTSSSAAVRQASRATIPLSVSEVSYCPRHQFF